MVEQPKKVLIALDTRWNYNRQLLHGVLRYAQMHRSWTFYIAPGRRYDILPPAENWDADAIIVSDIEFKLCKARGGTPMVVISFGSFFPGYVNVVPDDRRIAEHAVRHFTAKGFTHYAYYGIRNALASKYRKELFFDLLSEQECRSIDIPVNCLRSKEVRWEIDWLLLQPKPLAVYQ